MERVKFFPRMYHIGSTNMGDPEPLEDLAKRINLWLKENDGKIEIISRQMAVDRDGNPLVAIFYRPKA